MRKFTVHLNIASLLEEGHGNWIYKVKAKSWSNAAFVARRIFERDQECPGGGGLVMRIDASWQDYKSLGWNVNPWEGA